MAEGFSWVFELFDKFSGPARAMTFALKQFDDAANGSSSSFGRFVSALDHGLGIIEKVGQGIEGLGRMAMGGIDFALQAAMFKENTILGLEMILQSKQKAQALWKDIISLAANTPFETKDIADFTRNFVMSGFGPKDALKLTQAVSDMGVARGMDPNKMRMLAFWLDEIKSAGHLSRRALTRIQYDQLIGANFVDAAFKRNGLISPNQGGAPVDSVTGIKILLDAIMMQTGESKIGQTSQRAGRELLSGAFSTLKSRGVELLGDLDKSSAFDQLRKFIFGVADYLKPGGEAGNMVIDAASKVFNGLAEAIFGPLDKTDLLDKVTKMIGGFLKWVKSVDWKGVFSDIKDAFTSVYDAIKPFLAIFEAFVKVDKFLRENTGGLRKYLALVGGSEDPFAKAAEARGSNVINGFNAVAGFVSGIWGSGSAVKDAVAGAVVDPLKNGVRTGLDMHSPSKVMEKLGRQASEGFELGLQGPSGLAGSLQGAVSSPPAVAAGGVGKMTVPIHIHASDSVAEKVKDLVVSALTGAFEEVSIEMGVA